MSRILVIGATGGIGKACVKVLQTDHEVTAWSSHDLDLNYPDRIFTTNLTEFDTVMNMAGHSQGTYRGFLDNAWSNQLSQIMVNYVSNLALFKHYANSRSQGQYVWISTSLLSAARPFHSVYASTKMASKFALDLAQQEVEHIQVLEVNVGPTRTNFRHRNLEGTRTVEDINMEYDSIQAMDPDHVAKQIVQAWQHKQTLLTL